MSRRRDRENAVAKYRIGAGGNWDVDENDHCGDKTGAKPADAGQAGAPLPQTGR
ncbi:hypothetical protein QWZ10_17025 [Paracoccus cavernae]|uniref:Uncharacterized protein n=1 Tax=Paracoccus cavernae TaxID=1571207 RepID=A0ABT8D8D6_9RHOB|nr:hypothetical protein [Paracoccus cavernae]